jgi:glycosyltransferase involved in cell wall biosynthesis
MKVALVHDYLKEYGGAERVLQALHEIWPEAPIYTAFWVKNSPAGRVFAKAKVKESWLAPLIKHKNLYSLLRFLTPLVWKSFNLRKYDLVISSASWAITKGFAQGKTKEICYCHTPPRYLYGYETSRNWQKHWYIRTYALLVNHFMRTYDFRQAQKVSWFIANSQVVKKRIKKFYRREATVIYPPVEINREVKLTSKKENYFLTGGRLERAKNFNLVVKACSQTKLPLKIFGSGTQEESLKKMAGPSVEFLGQVSDEQKQKLLSKAKAFLVAAADEDFGITPVEAMAYGCPVMAYQGGGYLESVVAGKTGEFFAQSTSKALGDKLKSFKTSKYQPKACRKQAEKFSKERFKKEMKEFVKKHA